LVNEKRWLLMKKITFYIVHRPSFLASPHSSQSRLSSSPRGLEHPSPDSGEAGASSPLTISAAAIEKESALTASCPSTDCEFKDSGVPYYDGLVRVPAMAKC
jgi:hypothetical protein